MALGEIGLDLLPGDLAVSALTIAELTAGPIAAQTPATRIERQAHVRWVRPKVKTLAFDDGCADAYEQIYAAAIKVGRKARGSRSVDLMIAATALAHDLPLYTLNAADLRGLEALIKIVDLS